MSVIFQNRAGNHAHYLLPSLWVLPALPLVYYLAGFRLSDVQLRVIFTLLAGVTILLPTAVLHMRYLLKSTGMQLFFTDSEFELFRYGESIRKFNVADVAIATVHKRHKKIEHDTGFYYGTWYKYFYVQLVLSDGTELKLPCTIFRNLADVPFKYQLNDRSYPI